MKQKDDDEETDDLRFDLKFDLILTSYELDIFALTAKKKFYHK